MINFVEFERKETEIAADFKLLFVNWHLFGHFLLKNATWKELHNRIQIEFEHLEMEIAAD